VIVDSISQLVGKNNSNNSDIFSHAHDITNDTSGNGISIICGAPVAWSGKFETDIETSRNCYS